MKKKWTFLPIFLVLMFFICEMNPVQAKVTSYLKYRQMDEELGKEVVSCLFNLDDGKKMAFCIQRSKITPGAGSKTSGWLEIFNEDLRKVLYYGYGGPEDMGYTVVETSCAAAAANGDNETSIGDQVLEEIRLLESPPENFRVWKVITNNGISQDLAFYTTLLTGELNLEKTSSDETCTLSLEGAVYGVYTDEECQNQVGELKTDAEGISETLTLDEGTYYVKELRAPEGYLLDEEIYLIDILVERTTTLVVSDDPIPQVEDLVIHKVNVIGEALEGAEFSIYEDEACSMLVGTGTTDADGKLIFPELTKDAVYYLKETKAPDGYMLSDDIHTVTVDGTEVPIINERIFVLPNTGSSQGIMMNLLGIWCIVKSLKKEK